MRVQIREHRLDDLGRHGRGCVVIEVDRLIRVHENSVPALVRSLGVGPTLMRPPLHRKRRGFALWALDGGHTLRRNAGMRRVFPWLT